jgi:hypothetical protein
MFRKWTPGDLDDVLIFDDAVADVLPYLEPTPFHVCALPGLTLLT